jgi:ubiquinone/menaquinone biosynthesis C-methylase UbiE
MFTRTADSPRGLMEICMGPWAFKTLAVAHEFGVFDLLAEHGPMTVPAVARQLRCAERPIEMLLTGNAALGLLEVHDGHFGNSPVAARFLVTGAEFHFGGYVQQLHRRSYDGWGRLADAVRSNQPVSWDPSTQETVFDDELDLVRRLQDAMHAVSRHSASVVASALDLSAARRLLDVGGGPCTYAIEFARRNPELEIGVVDLPTPCKLAEARIEEAGLSERISTVPADFRTDELPGGYDTVFLSMVLHDWPPEQCRALLRKAHRALLPGGRVIINELFVADDKSGPLDAALMSLHMLVNTWGRNYTVAECRAWLAEAGFTDPARLPVDAVSSNGLLIARRGAVDAVRTKRAA